MSDFLESIKEKIIGKYVEIYQGDTHRTLVGYQDYTHESKSVLYGKVVSIEGTCLTLEVRRHEKLGQVYINTWSISTLTVPETGISMDDVYWAAPEVTHDSARKK